MKKILFIVLTIGIGVSYFSCTSVEPITTKDVERAQKIFPAITIHELREGQNLYSKKCGSCHYLHKPEKFSSEKWKFEIQKMSGNSKATTEERELILYYLLSRAKTDVD